MMLWEAKASLSGTYTTMKTPSGYDVEGTDLDSNSYRSVNTGNLIRNIVGKKWLTVKLSFNYITESELETICTMINNYPIYVKLKSPLFGTSGIWEGEMYCSKYNVKMIQNGNNNSQKWGDLSFTLVQSKKVSGQ